MDALSETQMMSVESKLDDMAAAASRVGRKDWLLMFGGAVLALFMERLLPHEVVWDIVRLVGDGLGHLFGGDGLPVLPPLSPPTPPVV